MTSPSLAPVNGVAEGLELRAGGADVVLVFKSSLRGLCLELPGRDGDDGGSFFTTGFETRDSLGDRFPSDGVRSFGVVAKLPSLWIDESMRSIEGAAFIGARVG
jgi:hypothetical protein